MFETVSHAHHLLNNPHATQLAQHSKLNLVAGNTEVYNRYLTLDFFYLPGNFQSSCFPGFAVIREAVAMKADITVTRMVTSTHGLQTTVCDPSALQG